MKLCHCGHPIIVLAHERQEGQPEPTECACCRTGVHFGPRLDSTASCPVVGCYIRGPHTHEATTAGPAIFVEEPCR